MNDLAHSPTRADIEALQAQMVKLPQAKVVTQHYFADGMYVREMACDAGTTIVGKVHKREHFFILLSGEMTLVWDGRRERIQAPRILISSPGIKRAGHAHTDCVCLNLHRTDSTDLDEIERELVEADPTALFDARNEVIPALLEHV